MAQNPNFPLYIVSKGRYDSRYTSKALEYMRVPYTIVVEESEYDKYCSVISKEKVLILDKKYQEEYDAFDNLGMTKGKGAGAVRNFIWDRSIKNGDKWHWVMDDNINGFYRLNHNLKVPVKDGTIFRCMEDFVLRYENVAMAGPNYHMFAPRKTKQPPFVKNTRIYSCNLIRNDIPFRWRGRYNEDLDLSLRILKGSWCTIQFNAFLQYKITTQALKGGNTTEFYAKEGTLPKSKMIVKMHPDVAKITYKWGRWHHTVNYKPFKNRALIKKKGIKIKDGVNNYGMELTKKT